MYVYGIKMKLEKESIHMREIGEWNWEKVEKESIKEVERGNNKVEIESGERK